MIGLMVVFLWVLKKLVMSPPSFENTSVVCQKNINGKRLNSYSSYIFIMHSAFIKGGIAKPQAQNKSTTKMQPLIGFASLFSM